MKPDVKAFGESVTSRRHKGTFTYAMYHRFLRISVISSVKSLLLNKNPEATDISA